LAGALRSQKSQSSNQLIHGGNLMTAFSGKVLCVPQCLEDMNALAVDAVTITLNLSRSVSKPCVVA
jgi:hypothetical protein